MSTVTLLGVKGGPAIRPGSPMPTCSLIEMDDQVILVDAALGAAAGVVRAGVALGQISAIWITHLHSDHYLELGPLLHTAWTAGLSRPIPIYGPKGLDAYWRHFCAAMQFDIDLRIHDEGRPDLRDLVTIHTIDDGQTHDMGAISVRVMRNDHPPITDSFALRFDGTHQIVMSGDTAPIDAMVAFSAHADLLVHEAMLTAGVDALCARVGNGDDRLRTHLMLSHAPADAVARIAARAGVKALALNHLIPSDDPDFGPADWLREVTPHFTGTFHIGEDGLRIPLS